MLIWTGWGLGISILGMIIAGIIDALLQIIMTGKCAGSTTLVFFIAGVIIYFIGKKVNNPSNDKELIDNQTGEKYLFQKRHTMFYINVEYFGILLIIFGIVDVISFLLK